MKYELPPNSPRRPGQHFGWSEWFVSATGSAHGIICRPTTEHVAHMVRVTQTLLDPIREAAGMPVHITSGFRTAELNRLIGGSKTSRHMDGLAADIRIGGRSRTAETVKRSRVMAMWAHANIEQVDQAIYYDAERGGHLHIGLAPVDLSARRQLLHAVAGGGYRRVQP